MTKEEEKRVPLEHCVLSFISQLLECLSHDFLVFFSCWATPCTQVTASDGDFQHRVSLANEEEASVTCTL